MASAAAETQNLLSRQATWARNALPLKHQSSLRQIAAVRQDQVQATEKLSPRKALEAIGSQLQALTASCP